MISIKLEDIKEFSKKYNSNIENKKIESKVTKEGLIKACINENIIKENEATFNIELSETKRYNQKESLRCWAFSGFNMIKRNMAENLSINVINFELSDNYVAFFHRLEKANLAYEKVINSRKTDVNKIFKKEELRNIIEEVGNWKHFVNIVKKYGLVPLEIMKTTVEGENSVQVTNLYSETVKSNIFKLIELKNQNSDIKYLRSVKKKMLQENYEFLSKVYGEPPKNFDYKYIDINGKSIELKGLTPNEFVKQFLSIDIENFILLSNGLTFSYGEKIKNNNSNMVENKTIEFLNISPKELKELTIKQLKDNMPVMVGISIKKFANFEYGILDTRLYDYENLVKYKKLNKEQGVKINDIFLHHWMTITGVYIENENPKRWKVEDSYGSDTRVNGYWIMNDNYFTDYVFTCIINKKYLSKKQLELYNKKAIREK